MCRVFFLVGFVLQFVSPCWALTATWVNPLDFGTVTDPSSAQSINVSPTSSGAGALLLTDITKKCVWVKILQESGTVTTSCGTVSVSNIVHEGNGTSSYTPGSSGASTYTLTFGGTGILSSFTGSSSCTISGNIASALRYAESSNCNKSPPPNNFTTIELPISLTVNPTGGSNMSIAHNAQGALNFGNICYDASMSQGLTITPAGIVSSSNLICPAGSDISADSFTVTGETGQTFSVNLPVSASLYNGANAVTVTDFTSSCLTNCTLAGNSMVLSIGGTLTVPAATAVGSYSGTYSLSITY